MPRAAIISSPYKTIDEKKIEIVGVREIKKYPIAAQLFQQGLDQFIKIYGINET